MKFDPGLTSAVLFVSSPLQLLCAIEAMVYFEIDQGYFIIRDNGTKNADQMRALVADLRLDDKVVWIGNSRKRGAFLSYMRLYKKLRSSRINYGFFGDYGINNVFFIGSLCLDSVFMVDDGFEILKTRRIILKNKSSNLELSRGLKFIRYYVFGLRLKKRPDIKFFSFILSGDAVVKHSLGNVVRLFSGSKASVGRFSGEKVFYIDTPWLETRQLSRVEYEKIILIVREMIYEERHVCRVLHRLQELDSVFGDLGPNTSVYESQMPIEIEFLKNGIVPELVIASISTALLSIKKIYPSCRVVALNVVPSAKITGFIEESEVEDMAASYEIMKKAGIQVIDIDNKGYGHYVG